MKKICFVTTVSLTMKMFVVEIAKHLHNESGYDVTLICDTDEEFAASLPPYLHYIPVPMSRGIDLSGFRSVWRLYKIFRKEGFDLVQYSTPNAACYASIAAWLARAKIRLYAQWGIRYIGLEGLSRKIFKMIEKMVCLLSTHVRSQSPLNRRFVIDEKVCKENKVSVIGIGGTIGVELSQCDKVDASEKRASLREKHGIPGDAFVYGFVGRINRDKGVNELIEAFCTVREAHSNAVLLLIGGEDDKNPIDSRLMQIAQKDDRIVMTGNVPSHEVSAYMAAMDVLVHPTYREGFGKVIQEAMGMRLPVITTDIPGPSEVIEDGVSGLLARVKDSADLAEKMERLLTEPATRRALSDAGRTRAETYFDRPIMLRNIAEDMAAVFETHEKGE